MLFYSIIIPCSPLGFNSLYCAAWQVEGEVIEYCKFTIELQALAIIGTSCKLAPAGASKYSATLACAQFKIHNS